jgi:hypothetical protein
MATLDERTGDRKTGPDTAGKRYGAKQKPRQAASRGRVIFEQTYWRVRSERVAGAPHVFTPGSEGAVGSRGFLTALLTYVAEEVLAGPIPGGQHRGAGEAGAPLCDSNATKRGSHERLFEYQRVRHALPSALFLG